MQQKGIVYLIPSVIEEKATETIPSYIVNTAKDCQVFFVENERTARRFLKSICKEIVIDDLTFYLLNKHSEPSEIDKYLAVAESGSDVGLLSEYIDLLNEY